jgi:hypothetical protein
VFKPGDRVRVCRPKYTQGGTGFAQDKSGTVQSVSGRFIVLILDGQLDELGFFACELDLLTNSTT